MSWNSPRARHVCVPWVCAFSSLGEISVNQVKWASVNQMLRDQEMLGAKKKNGTGRGLGPAEPSACGWVKLKIDQVVSGRRHCDVLLCSLGKILALSFWPAMTGGGGRKSFTGPSYDVPMWSFSSGTISGLTMGQISVQVNLSHQFSLFAVFTTTTHDGQPRRIGKWQFKSRLFY